MTIPNDTAHGKTLYIQYINTKGEPVWHAADLWRAGFKPRVVIWHHEGAYGILSKTYIEAIFQSFDDNVAAGAEKNSLTYDVPWSHVRELDYHIGKVLAAGPTD